MGICMDEKSVDALSVRGVLSVFGQAPFRHQPLVLPPAIFAALGDVARG